MRLLRSHLSMADSDKAREELLITSLASIGTSGLKRTGGFIYEEFLPKLQGLNGAKFYREMEDNASVLGTVRWVFRALVTQLTWKFEPCERGGYKGQEYADFLESCRDDMSHSWSAMLHDVVSMLTYGWAFMETTYKVRRGLDMPSIARSKHTDGRFGWRHIAIRAQDTLFRWEFDESDGSLRGMHQFDPYTAKSAFIPIEKALLFRVEPTKGNPEGRSLLRNSVVDYHYLKRHQEIEAIGGERDLNGLPDMQVPASLLSVNASPEQKALRAAIEQMLAELKQDERAYIMRPSETLPDGTPSGFKFGLVSAGGSRAIDTNAIIQRYETRILRSVLLQFLVLGQQGNAGSYSVGVTHNNLFIVAFKSFVDGIVEVFNRHAVTRLLELNGMDCTYAPELKYSGLEGPQLTELADYVLKLVQATVLTPTVELERELLERAGLPHGHLEQRQDPDEALADAQNANEMLAAIGYKPDGRPDNSKDLDSMSPQAEAKEREAAAQAQSEMQQPSVPADGSSVDGPQPGQSADDLIASAGLDPKEHPSGG